MTLHKNMETASSFRSETRAGKLVVERMKKGKKLYEKRMKIVAKINKALKLAK